MKQKIEIIKREEGRKSLPFKINKAKNGLILVFSICITSLFMLVALDGEAPTSKGEESEIISVFKETYLYDFLDLDNCKKSENIEGSV